MPTPLTLTRRSFLASPILLAACKTGWDVLELSGLTMGTGYQIVAVDHSRKLDKAEVTRAVEASLARVTAQMSNWDAGSDVSRFNAARADAPFALSPDFARVMQAADTVHAASQGAFDVTVGPLIDLWGFGSGAAQDAAPRPDAIAAARAISGQSRVLSVNGDTLTKHHPDAGIYLSAIGKGYGVDDVARTLAGFGLTDFMVEIGGDLVTAGMNPDGRPWQIGIETPEAFDRGIERVVAVSDHGMATSGDYRNFFVQDGQRFSHIIDPTTGHPVTHRTTSVTVLAENAMLADAWATALLVLGSDTGRDLADAQGLAALFLDRSDSGTTGITSSAFDALTA